MAPTSSRRRAGFTLIELLVVIGIIVILTGVLFSVMGGVQARARKIQARNDMRNIGISILNYYTEYRKYPINDNQSGAVQYGDYDTVYGDPGGLYSTADLFDILRAVPDDNFNKDNKLNPSKTAYWEGQFVKDVNNPRGGITTKDFMDGPDKVPKGSFVDPWGSQYIVWIDANRDGDLSTAAGWFYKDIKPGDVKLGEPPLGTAFGTVGPDGDFGTNIHGNGNGILKGSDDLVTW